MASRGGLSQTNSKAHIGNQAAVKLKEVTGTFVVPYDQPRAVTNNESSDEDDDEEADDILLDYRDMHAADSLIRTRVPKQTKVEIKDTAGRKHTCHGKFLMTQSYWQVTAKMYKTFLRSAPVYTLRPDLQEKNMITIFLSDCLSALKDEVTNNATKMCFETYCRMHNLKPTFFDLGRVLDRYCSYEKTKGCCLGNGSEQVFGDLPLEDHSVHVKELVCRSDIGAAVLVAASHPGIVRNLSQLFPFSFPQICNRLKRFRRVDNCDTEEEEYDNEEEGSGPLNNNNGGSKGQRSLLERAEGMAENSPWEFCFRDILSRKLKLFGVEASLRSFEESGFLPLTPQTEKDALYTYEVLKVDAKKDGHMYMPLRVLREYYYFNKLDYHISGLERWTQALDYLESNGVVRREEFGGDINVFLVRNWQAEVDTAEAFGTILDKHREEPFLWDINMHSPEFANLRTDEDQLRASHLICSAPVVVMSGRGGCGKTTVITKLLKHLCDREEKLIEEEKNRKLEEFENQRKAKAGYMSNIPPNPDQRVIKLEPSDNTDHKFIKQEVLDGHGGNIGVAKIPGNIKQEPKDSQQPMTSAGEDKTLEGSLGVLSLSNNTSDLNEHNNNSSRNTGQDSSIGNKKDKTVKSGSSSDRNGESSSNSQPGRESKAERLRREVVEDLLKIISQCKESDNPLLADYKRRMLLTAPTGKAARLLGCKAGLPSATLHSVLTSWQVYKRSGAETEWRYTRVETLVVDECSLVSVRLFANVVKVLLDNANLRKIVLLGDIRQLPSIEPGNFLKDVFKTLGRPISRVERSVVTSGHFSMAVELSHNHRSESELIVSNAEQISRERMPVFDSSRNFHQVETSLRGGDNERDQVVRRLLRTAPELNSHLHSQFVAFRNAHCTAINELCCQFYNNHSLKRPSQSGKREKFDFQVGDKICLGKNNQVTSRHKVYLDDYRQDFPELAEALKEQEGLMREKQEREEGVDHGSKPQDAGSSVGRLERTVNCDKTRLDATGVMDLLDQDDATFDTTISAMKEKEESEKERRLQRAKEKQKKWKKETSLKNAVISLLGKDNEKLCNGEVFFIMDEIDHFEQGSNKDNLDSSRAMRPTKYFLLSDRDPSLPRVVCVPFKQLRRLCKMRHSWVRTIHTYQGSESGTVVYLVGPAIPQTWQHVYTAVTRGRRAVYIVGDWQELHKAVTRQDTPRRSRLAHRLVDVIDGHSEAVETCEREFQRRLQEDSVGHTSHLLNELAHDMNMLDDVFGSDDSWLAHAETSIVQVQKDNSSRDCSDDRKVNVNKEVSSQPYIKQEILSQPSVSDDYKQEVCDTDTEPFSTLPHSVSHPSSEYICREVNNIKQEKSCEMDVKDTKPSISNLWQPHNKNISSEVDIKKEESLQMDDDEIIFSSSEEEHEESIFADLSRYREKKKKRLANSQKLTTNSICTQVSPPQMSSAPKSPSPSCDSQNLSTNNTSTSSRLSPQQISSPPNQSLNSTPIKRKSNGFSPSTLCSEWEMEGETSPNKVKRSNDEVGTPLLNSFSNSLTFDGERSEKRSDLGYSEESPIGVRRKL